jgi:hypothetical protein
MAKYGYYKQSGGITPHPQLIQEFEGTGIRKDDGVESVTIYADQSDERRVQVAVVRLNKGEWVALVDGNSPQRGIS